jgi:excinuclease ABC subunit C
MRAVGLRRVDRRGRPPGRIRGVETGNVDQLPDHPGVYLMKDAGGKVIYVGKANSLRKRVRSYFGRAHESARLRALVARIEAVETFLVDSELEALILELNLIKEHRPRYNIQLKDDKRYPFIRVTVNERIPRVFGTRQPGEDGSLTFGPYTDAKAMRRSSASSRFSDADLLLPASSKTVRLVSITKSRSASPCEDKIMEEEAGAVEKVISFSRARTVRWSRSPLEMEWRRRTSSTRRLSAIRSRPCRA